MNTLSDQQPTQAISVLLVEDDAPTSWRLQDALTKAGRPYQLGIQPGQKHGFRGKESLNFRNAAIAKFFEENL